MATFFATAAVLFVSHELVHWRLCRSCPLLVKLFFIQQLLKCRLSIRPPSPFPKPHERIREISAPHCHLTSPTSGWREKSAAARFAIIQVNGQGTKSSLPLLLRFGLQEVASCPHIYIGVLFLSTSRYCTIRTGDWSQQSLMMLMLAGLLMMSKTTAPCLRSILEINASQWIVAILF